MRYGILLAIVFAACDSGEKRIVQDTVRVRDTVQIVHDTLYEKRAPIVTKSSHRAP